MYNRTPGSKTFAWRSTKRGPLGGVSVIPGAPQELPYPHCWEPPGCQGASLSLAGLFSDGCRWQCGWLTFRLDKSTPHSSRNFSDAARAPPPPHFPPPHYSVFPTPRPSCGKEHIKAIWSHSFWAPVLTTVSVFYLRFNTVIFN